MSCLTNNPKLSGDLCEMKDFATRICKDYLNGAWKSVNAENIGFKHISGGLSNLLYQISLPEDLEDKVLDEPKQVLIRVYGQTHGEGALEAIITESVIFTLLSERGLGPKLHGVFPGGRIEQYINARPLLTKELAVENLSVQIAQKMATIHSMEVPLHKDPSWLWRTIEKWLNICENKINSHNVAPDIDLREELIFLKNEIEKIDSPVVFCHNDMQEGNILLSMDTENNNIDDPNIILIDFEYCSYNYRAFDIANHFVEWMYDYTNKEFPFFHENHGNYPTEKQRLLFINAYLAEKGSNENPSKLMKEVEVLTLASHFFWTLWAFINDGTSQIPFGYLEYGTSRLNSYLELKKTLLKGESWCYVPTKHTSTTRGRQ